MRDFFPIVNSYLDTSELIKFIKSNKLNLIYYLSAINLPRSIQVDSDLKFMMQKVHVEYPLQVLQSIIESPGVQGVFPLTSKMFSVQEEKDLIITADNPPNPQSYYGESRALFWDRLKALREKYSIDILSPILFNHESKYRFQHSFSEKFALQKLWNLLHADTSIERILNSGIDFNAREDWLNASDVCNAIFKLVEANIHEDIVLSSGRGSSIYKLLLDFLEANEVSESIQIVREEMSKSMELRPCLVGDVSKLGLLLGKIEQRIVLS
jgi:GDP-D-mannose dehydratase